MAIETNSLPRLRDLRWYRPILGFLFVAAVALGGASLAASGSSRTTLFVVSIAVAIAFCLMFVSFAWQVFGHFLSKTDSALWLWVLVVLIVITTLGIAALLFAFFLVFAYYPGELKRELEVALPEPELERRFRDLRDKLEQISGQFVSETGSHIVAFTQNFVDEAVLQNPIHAKNLGHERLGVLKREVAEFVSAVPALVAERIGVSAEWPHRTRSSNPLDEIGSSSITDLRTKIDDTISSMLGPLGPALVGHGFAKSGLIETWVPLQQPDRLKYNYKIKWSQEMNARFDEYTSTYGDMKRFARALVAIHSGRERDEAKQLWERS